MNDKDLLNIIALNLRVERTIKRMTQAQLAELVEVHEKYIGKIEAGKQNITIRTLNKLANALDIEITKLLEIKK